MGEPLTGYTVTAQYLKGERFEHRVDGARAIQMLKNWVRSIEGEDGRLDEPIQVHVRVHDGEKYVPLYFIAGGRADDSDPDPAP